MRVIFAGDVVGRAGRDAVIKYVPKLKEKYRADAVIINGENAAHGFGITEIICKEFYDVGVDCITTGNHAFSQREIVSYIERDKKIIRPLNYPDETPGFGYCEINTPSGKLLIINLMGREFMQILDCPFRKIDNFLNKYNLGGNVTGIFVDFHAEVTSEKMAMGRFLDGRVSCVIGTHTHVPTADARILSGGTAYQTDAGMTGDYDSVIGFDDVAPINGFLKKIPKERFTPASGEGTFSGILIDIDNQTGKSYKIKSIKFGGIIGEDL